MDIRTATWKARNAANYLSMALMSGDGSKSYPTCLQIAVDELTEAANALGFVLVRSRLPKTNKDDTEAA